MVVHPDDAYAVALEAFTLRRWDSAYAFAEILCRWFVTGDGARYFKRVKMIQALTIRDEAARQLGLTVKPFTFTD